ncbi:fluoride efflux transporter FluC [Segniliparus rugosus]|uniref:Fluoride-specific ion channel FluC n=1 Tax=Segniliparus rugosus (strain ATCC BAA-974 / DSM 45345 / CCUG 50838 / CIP 108380 / JCM 13579 / CDC 945) TaxID=679197 RepID=E5XKP2_SEGRC|nr:CrcB family protein [Segniliparus rugosus]EFV15089.1 crcB protein [Segniliparus rugosus ATCC BAA-974]
MTLAEVFVGGVLGALVRYLVDRSCRSKWPTGVPWGIVACNLGGAFLLGVLAGATTAQAVGATFGIGFCGSLTTYSTFSYDTARLWEQGKPRAALGNLLLNVALGLPIAATGIAVGSLLFS